MQDVLVQSTGRQSFHALMMSIFGLSALLLAAIGLYGLMAYSVEQRTQEIGIRVALGARPGNVRRMVVLQAMRLVLAGIAIGMAAAFGLSRYIASLLFGVTPQDPGAFLIVPALLISVAVAAAWIPARRASLVDPIQALRSE
jgi:ABC-type antimicrobial peptide transport system permease subunit